MSRHFALKTVLVLLLLTASLVVMVGMKQYTLNTGKVILLKTIPVDPRSLFRGDYVRLNYDISRIKIDEVDGDKDFNRHQKIFVVLVKGEKYWHVQSVHHQPPVLRQDQLMLKGKVNYVGGYLWNPETRKSEKVKNLNVTYGIENYFVPEGQGRVLERVQRDDRVDIQVAVDKNGNAGIKGVLVNDQQRYVETLF